MEKTLEGFRGRCTTLWSCRDFTDPQITVYTKPQALENNMNNLEKCFKLNLETQPVSGQTYFVWQHRKRQIQPVWMQMFLFVFFRAAKKMSKTNESCAQLQELIKFNKYKLPLRCRCETENYSVPVQGTLFN